MARLILFLILFVSIPAWAAETRVALVIGNSNYKDAPLTAPLNDARQMKAALTELGFKVTAFENLGRMNMQRAVRSFIEELSSADTVSLFYFAGHGMQSKGKNYLIPVDAEVEHEDDIQFQGIDVQYILDKFEEKKNGMNILILDACRNNPFSRRGIRGTSGLAAVDGPPGTLVAFAAAPGKVATERAGGNGIYTRNILENIRQPGLQVEEVFKRVRAGVLSETSEQQVPWENTSLIKDFYFRGARAGTGYKPAIPDSETEAWKNIESSRNIYDFIGFYRRFPQTRYLNELLARINAILARLKPAPPALRLTELPSLLRESYAGIRFRSLNRYSAEYFGLSEAKGILVTDVSRGSAAERAGINPGDIILSVNGRPWSNHEDVRESNKTVLPGEYVEGVIWRNKAEITFTGVAARASIERLLEHAAVDQLKNKEYERSRLIYEYLAAIGDTNGQAALGLLYLRGFGVTRDYSVAESWLLKAANQGSKEAAALLATLYTFQNSAARKDEDAYKWAKIAAEAGLPEGAAFLATAYFRGTGTKINQNEGVRWAQIAAEQGQPMGMWLLGIAYEAGVGGLTKDRAQAITWYKRAADGGLQQARDALRRVGE